MSTEDRARNDWKLEMESVTERERERERKRDVRTQGREGEMKVIFFFFKLSSLSF